MNRASEKLLSAVIHVAVAVAALAGIFVAVFVFGCLAVNRPVQSYFLPVSTGLDESQAGTAVAPLNHLGR